MFILSYQHRIERMTPRLRLVDVKTSNVDPRTFVAVKLEAELYAIFFLKSSRHAPSFSSSDKGWQGELFGHAKHTSMIV